MLKQQNYIQIGVGDGGDYSATRQNNIHKL